MNAHLLAGIANLADQLQADGISAEEWQDHELAWRAYVAERRATMMEAAAKVMLAFEAMAKHEPEKITPDVAQRLHWWTAEGGRKQWLGELPATTRRALEEEASKLPRRDS